MHLAHTRDKRSESPDYRYETGYHNRLAAILAVELVRLVQITFPEYPGIWIAEKLTTEEMSYHIVAGVPEERRNEHYKHQEVHIKRRARQGGNCPCNEKKRVPRKERGNHKSCLTEYYEEQYGGEEEDDEDIEAPYGAYDNDEVKASILFHSDGTCVVSTLDAEADGIYTVDTDGYLYIETDNASLGGWYDADEDTFTLDDTDGYFYYVSFSSGYYVP